MNYLWLDLETTALDPRKGFIIEVAALIDDESYTLGQPPTGVVNGAIRLPQLEHGVPPSSIWDQEAYDMHNTNGLLKTLSTGGGERLFDVENRILEALMPYPPKSVMLAGNSVHFDRSFLRVHMPLLDAALHYRHMDVSCLITFFESMGAVKRDSGPKPHRAMPDVQRSIATYYSYVDMCRNLHMPVTP